MIRIENKIILRLMKREIAGTLIPAIKTSSVRTRRIWDVILESMWPDNFISWTQSGAIIRPRFFLNKSAQISFRFMFYTSGALPEWRVPAERLPRCPG